MDIDQLYEAWCKKVSEPDLMEELNLIRHQETEIESRLYIPYPKQPKAWHNI